jgi:flavin reductase (DIM6/NTAB) family NADH-FMN oxidoreductase RutF
MRRSGPKVLDEAAKRAALRLFTYGLYVVTVHDGDDENGFTANWLTQVSFDPPMLAVSVENSSHSIEIIHRTRIFTLNVLPSGARELAGLLGKRWANVPDKLRQAARHPGPNGCAVLDEALAYLECEVESSAPAGDSTLFVARIVGAGVLRDGQPLTMGEAGFRHAG